jgi:hypothetical protein
MSSFGDIRANAGNQRSKSMSSAFSSRRGTGIVAGLAGVALVLGGSAAPAFAAPEDSVDLPDAAFKSCLINALGFTADATVTEGDLASLTELNCAGDAELPEAPRIEDITGAEYLTAIEALNLANNSIADLSPLGGLTQLTSLDISYNNVLDLSPLADLTNLVDSEAAPGLYAEEQSYTWESFPVNTPVDLGLRDVDGEPIIPTIGDEDGSYDVETNTVTFTEPGAKDVTWTSTVNVGTYEALFSGTFALEVTSPVPAPTNVTAVSDAPGEVLFSWDQVTDTADNGDVETYEVRYRAAGSTAWTSLATGGSSARIDLGTAGAGNAYEFQIATITTTGAQSLYTEPVSVDVKAFPAAVTGVIAEAAKDETGDDIINVSWDEVTDTADNGDVEEYIVSYHPVNDPEDVQEVRSATPEAVLANLIEQQVYSITVSYVTTTGVEAPASATTIVELPGALAGVTGISAEVTSTTATVRWTPITDTNGNGDVAEYYAVVAEGGRVLEETATVIPGDENEVIFTGLKPNTSYTFGITYSTTTGAIGSVAFSGSVVTPATAEAPALTDLAATAGTQPGQAVLTWTPVSSTSLGTGGNGEIVSYTGYSRVVGTTEWIAIGSEEGNDLSNTVDVVNLTNGSYEFALTYTTDTGVTSPLSNTASLIVTNGVQQPGGNDNTGTVGGTTGPRVDSNANSQVAQTGGADMSGVALAAGGGLVGLALLILGAGAYRKRREGSTLA